MLASGVRLTPGSACLRCQLRLVLSHLRDAAPIGGLRCHALRGAARRPFATSLRPHQHYKATEDLGPSRSNEERRHVYREIYPNGRLVGRPGHQQRQLSEPLVRESLGEPSEVIVFRDVVDDATNRRAFEKDAREPQVVDDVTSKPLSAEEIEAEISEEHLEPSEDEVHASIEALRPQDAGLEKHEFDSLVEQLVDSYNHHQLSGYLAKAAPHGSSVEPSSTIDKFSAWRPGRSPIKERLSSLPKQATRSGKTKVAENILRLTWGLTMPFEEQAIGELEIRLRTYQQVFLCGLVDNKRPKWQSLLSSPLLVRSVEVQPVRANGVLRITARRQDAEQAAAELLSHLATLSSLTLELSFIKPLLGKHGWPSSMDLLFQQKDLDVVQQTTQAVVRTQPTGDVMMYGLQADCLNARRLCCDLLDFEKIRNSYMIIDPPKQKAIQARLLELPTEIPFFADSSLHQRDRSRSLIRRAQPLRKPSAEPGVRAGYLDQKQKVRDGIRRGKLTSRIALASKDAKYEYQIKPHAGEISGPNIWRNDSDAFQPGDWEAQVGYLLRYNASAVPSAPSKKSQTKNSLPPLGKVFLRQVPALEAVMTHFVPSQPAGQALPNHAQKYSPKQYMARMRPSRNRHRPRLVAHFIPSPFSADGAEAIGKLPSLELRFDYRSRPKYPASEPLVSLKGVRAVLTRQHVGVQLMDKAVDLMLCRKVGIFGNRETFAELPSVAEFIRRLDLSARGTGPLDAGFGIRVPMPGWLLHKNSDDSMPSPLVDVEYFLTRYEYEEMADFVPKRGMMSTDPGTAVPKDLRDWGKDMLLRVTEIDAGAFGGRRREVSLRYRHEPWKRSSGEEELVRRDGETEAEVGAPDTEDRALRLARGALGLVDLVTNVDRARLNPADEDDYL